MGIERADSTAAAAAAAAAAVDANQRLETHSAVPEGGMECRPIEKALPLATPVRSILEFGV